MSWCDNLGSTPSIGFQLDWHSLPSDILLGALSPIVDRMVLGDEQRFSIDLKDPLRLTFTSFDGFQYGLEPSRIYVSFIHRASIRTGIGGIPALVPSSKIATYTHLLSEVETCLFDAMTIINKLKTRRLTGIGVVSTTLTDESELPPGIRRFLSYASNPWSGSLEALTFQAQSVLEKKEHYYHQCNHTIIKSRKEDDPIQVIFDYQRIYEKHQDIDSNRLRTATDELKRIALDYFEQLAQGDRFDVE